MALLRRDPQAFALNAMQRTHPELFFDRLVDIVNPRPMHVRIDPALTGARLNVLNPALTESGMTGGPNTMLNLAVRIARTGLPVRLLNTVHARTVSADYLRGHLQALTGGTVPEIALEAATDPREAPAVGPNEVFMATHWSTAQQLKRVLPEMRTRQFLYLLQDFEPGFYAWSSNYALALETFGLDFWPVCNEALLAEHFFSTGVGRFGDPGFRDRLTVFDPAVEEALFHAPTGPRPSRPHRLLFYARPTNPRNLFGLGLEALRLAVADPVFAGWDLLAIGGRGSVPPIPLGHGHTLRPAPWRDYLGYAEQLQEADVMLAPMLSPHTGYPVLEMAASGGLGVTNSFGAKTGPSLTAISGNILTTEATVEGYAEALRAAARQVVAGRERVAELHLPRSWAAALDPVAERLAALVRQLAGAG